MGISQYDNLNYAQYKPLSMQEILTPAMMMREQHDKADEMYTKQAEVDAQSLLGLNPELDAYAIKTKQAHLDALKKAADELATKGFNHVETKKNIRDIRNQYNTEILPLQQALAVRQQMSDEVRKRKIEDPTYESTFDPSGKSLKDYLANPNVFNYDGVSKVQVGQSFAHKVGQVKEQMQKSMPDISGKIIDDVLLRYDTGLSPEQVNDLIQQVSKANGKLLSLDKSTQLGKIVKSLFNETMSEFGVWDKFKDNPDKINKIANSVAQYAVYGMNGPKLDKVHDRMSEEIRAGGINDGGLELLGQPTTKTISQGYKYNSVIKNQPSFNDDGTLVDPEKHSVLTALAKLSSGNAAESTAGSVVGNLIGGPVGNVVGGLIPGVFGAAKELYASTRSKEEQVQSGRLISKFAKEHGYTFQLGKKNSITERAAYDMMVKENEQHQKRIDKTNVTLYPVIETTANNHVLNNILKSQSPMILRLNDNYRPDSETEIGWSNIAEQHGVTKDQLLKYIEKTSPQTNIVGENGVYAIELPKKFKKVNEELVADGNETYNIGIATSDEQKRVARLTDRLRQSRLEGITGEHLLNDAGAPVAMKIDGKVRYVVTAHNILADGRTLVYNKVYADKDLKNFVGNYSLDEETDKAIKNPLSITHDRLSSAFKTIKAAGSQNYSDQFTRHK